MTFKNFPPSEILKPYIKCFWTFASDQDLSQEIMYPSGHVELAINISNGKVISHIGARSIAMPDIEVLGHLTVPSRVTAARGTELLVARFYPHTSSLFFPHPVSDFTNDSLDLRDILKNDSFNFYDRIMSQTSLEGKIKVFETFLFNRLSSNNIDFKRLKLVELICDFVNTRDESFNIEAVASYFGFSERFIQKLFFDWVGLTPKRYFTIQRFNKSLELLRSSATSLTSIANDCGYYDQAHFIKEFKSYTGLTPSQVKHAPLSL